MVVPERLDHVLIQFDLTARRIKTMTIYPKMMLLGVALLGCMSAAQAQTHTDFGAEIAGSADGSIPAYTGGGISPLPAAFKPDSGKYPDPFKDEKPLYSVTAQNLAEHAASITPGVQELLKRFPDYRLDVYPSHRTMQYPDWVLQNTRNQAGQAKLVGNEPGDGLEGVHAAIPFPQPSNGLQVMWNQAMRYQGPYTFMRFNTYFIDRSGSPVMVGDQEVKFMWPYYDRSATSLESWNYHTSFSYRFGPPAQVGQLAMQKWTINNSVRDDTTWVYTPGQRRVRIAPEMKYDSPVANIGGVLTFDELGGFNGRKDRFDFKLIGKQELLVPYNNYKAASGPGLVGKQHENPDFMRWEKHRVWVVEATLKPGKRHIYSKRVFFIDEDTWVMTNYEAYDKSGALYRVVNTASFFLYDKPRVGQPTQIIYDLTKGTWAVSGYIGDGRSVIKPYDEIPNQANFTPETMAADGVR